MKEMKEILVDLGFGEEAYITVEKESTFSSIKEECRKQTGKELFCIKYSFPIEVRAHNEF